MTRNEQPDYIWGAEAISAFLGLTPRQVYYAHAQGELPLGRISGKLFAERSDLVAYMRSRIGSANIHAGAA